MRRQRDYRDQPPGASGLGMQRMNPEPLTALARQGDGTARYPDRELRRKARDDLVLVGPPDEDEEEEPRLPAQRSVGGVLRGREISGDRAAGGCARLALAAGPFIIAAGAGLFVIEAGEDLGDGRLSAAAPRLRVP